MHSLLDNLQNVAVVITSLVTLASTVTAVTDTPSKSAGFKRKLYKILEIFALVTEKTKQK